MELFKTSVVGLHKYPCKLTQGNLIYTGQSLHVAFTDIYALVNDLGECEIIGSAKDRSKENGRIEKVIDIRKVKIIEIASGLNKLNTEIIFGGKFPRRLIHSMK